jgi:hypothetical protein
MRFAQHSTARTWFASRDEHRDLGGEIVERATSLMPTRVQLLCPHAGVDRSTDLYQLDTGHFAQEDHSAEIAAHIKRFATGI